MIRVSPGLLSHMSVTPPIVNLDQYVIACSHAFDFINNRNYSRKIWDYEKANYEGLNVTLHNNVDTDIFNEPNIDVIVEKFKTVLFQCASYFIPNRTITIRPQDKPYITCECRRAD